MRFVCLELVCFLYLEICNFLLYSNKANIPSSSDTPPAPNSPIVGQLTPASGNCACGTCPTGVGSTVPTGVGKLVGVAVGVGVGAGVAQTQVTDSAHAAFTHLPPVHVNSLVHGLPVLQLSWHLGIGVAVGVGVGVGLAATVNVKLHTGAAAREGILAVGASGSFCCNLSVVNSATAPNPTITSVNKTKITVFFFIGLTPS